MGADADGAACERKKGSPRNRRASRGKRARFRRGRPRACGSKIKEILAFFESEEGQREFSGWKAQNQESKDN